MTGKIFINYRRRDDPGHTGRLYDLLRIAFGPGQILMDVESIAPGLDFVSVINEQVSKCEVLLVVIGKGWIVARDTAGNRRLDNPEDLVRIEIEVCLRLGKRVIPVLMNDAEMPREEQLPETLRPLARRNAVCLRHDRFKADAELLIKALHEALDDGDKARPAPASTDAEAVARKLIEADPRDREEERHFEKEQQHLTWNGFALTAANWLTDDDRLVLETLSRGALLLLAFDRSPSGCWGKSYLYRRFASGSGLPLAGGSLTGTPLALLAVGSSTTLPKGALHRWAFETLSGTLTKTLADDGQYRTRYRIGQTGRVPEYEPQRHAAGGLLATLLWGSLEPRNLATLSALCTSPLGPMAWDRAIVARTLLQATYASFVPRKLRRLAQLRYLKILGQLIEMAGKAPTSALAWADPYDYGSSANNQWGTVWALLPSIVDPLTPKALQTSLRRAIVSLLLAQDAAASGPGSGLPSQVDPSGTGHGLHVCGTAIAALSWNFLAANPPDTANELDLHHEHARKATERLVRSSHRLLSQPSHFDARDPLSLEGYFAWAGLLLAVASTGTILSEGAALKILSTASVMDQVALGSVEAAPLVDQYLRCCTDEGLFDEGIGEIVARSAGRIALLYREVTSTEDDHAA